MWYRRLSIAMAVLVGVSVAAYVVGRPQPIQQVTQKVGQWFRPKPKPLEAIPEEEEEEEDDQKK